MEQQTIPLLLIKKRLIQGELLSIAQCLPRLDRILYPNKQGDDSCRDGIERKCYVIAIHGAIALLGSANPVFYVV